MTHILIPIKDIKKRIKSWKGHVEAKELQDLLETSKQISLDEKDIEVKAWEFEPKVDSNHSDLLRRGYKQALKDLL